MNDVLTELVDGLLERETDLGGQIAFAGANYPCSGGDQLVMRLLQEGGFRQTAQTTIVVRVAVIPAGVALPQQKQSLSYTSTPGAVPQLLRVDSVDTVFNAILVLTCQDPNQPS